MSRILFRGGVCPIACWGPEAGIPQEQTSPDQRQAPPPPQKQTPPKPEAGTSPEPEAGTPQTRGRHPHPGPEAGLPLHQRQAPLPMSRHPPPQQQCMLGDMGNEWAVCILLECNLVTARKQSLGQANIFAPVCHSVQKGGCTWSWEVSGPRGVWPWGSAPRDVPGGDPPRDGYCCGRYASYWNVFLLIIVCARFFCFKLCKRSFIQGTMLV